MIKTAIRPVTSTFRWGGGRDGAAPPSAPLRIFTPGVVLFARKSDEMFTERKHRTKLGVLLMYPRDMCIY